MTDRQKTIDDLVLLNALCHGTVLDDALALLKEQPQIVRCKDCKECYFASNRIQSEQTFACGKHGIDVTQDWFCADGEMRI